MKIKSFQFKRYRRRFRQPLMTSHGAISERTGWIVRIEEKGGKAGFGEAADSLPGFPGAGAESVEADRAILMQLQGFLRGIEFAAWRLEIVELIKDYYDSISPALRFAYETAAFDIGARIVGVPMASWISADTATSVPVNYLLPNPVDDWNRVKAEIAGSRYPAVKIKVGAASIADDIATVKIVQPLLDYSPVIRLDANGAWDYDTALAVLDVMSEYDIDYVEEPLKDFDLDLLTRLKNETGIEIGIDESLLRVDDIGAFLSSKACNVIILKPAVLGGILNTIHYSYLAQSHKWRTVLTSTLETEIGIAAQLHLAATLPGEHIPCGLDTLRLFRRANPLLTQVTDGRIELPPGSGIGDGIGEEIWYSM